MPCHTCEAHVAACVDRSTYKWFQLTQSALVDFKYRANTGHKASDGTQMNDRL